MFKKDFVWGSASASYQIEGAAYEDGKGMSIWDMFCKKPGTILGGHSGDDACDHYHRYKEDVGLMAEMGLKAYRFSLSWPRIIPDGTGTLSPDGIAFYNSLIDELLANGITPYITLYHWDLPLALHYQGGWLNKQSPEWFANYARVVVENFSDRVKYFMTFNEPQCFVGLGYGEGVLAPGQKMSAAETFPIAHNVLLAHGKAVQAMRKYGAADIRIGYAPCGSYPYPDPETPENIEIARKMMFANTEDTVKGLFSVSWWSDPVLLGTYPDDGIAHYGKYLPEGWRDDLETIWQPLDFLGQNIYEGFAVQAGTDGKPVEVKQYDGFPRTALSWPITPPVLKWAPRFLYERYKKPIYITENGMSCHDAVSLDGSVHDPNRIDYIHRYLLALKEAAEAGADIAGYFVWSLIDNFEWAKGYSERFGVVYVDYPTQRRIIKDSGHWYRSVVESNGGNL